MEGGWCLGLLTALLVSAFYSALSGWICGYLVETIFDQLQPLHTTEQATVHFKELLRNPLWGLSYHFIFLEVSVVLIYAGLRMQNPDAYSILDVAHLSC